MIQRLKILGNLMSHKPVRSRRFLLPAAVVAAMAVAFATLPAAVADQTGAVEAQTTVAPSTPQVEASEEAAPSSPSAPTSETLSSKSPKNKPTGVETSEGSTALPAAPSTSNSPSALPTPSATFTERVITLQQTAAKAEDTPAALAVGPGTNQAVLSVKKGGDRTTGTNVTALSGATFDFYRTNSDTLTGGTKAYTCTTDTSGTCSVTVTLPSSSNYFYARETVAPTGWGMAVSWGSSSDHIRYKTGRIRQTDSVNERTIELPGDNRTWPNVRKNNDAPQKCGIKMAVVYDLSNSVTRPEKDTNPTLMSKYIAAGVKFVDALTGTPSSIALHTFASTAPAQNSSPSGSNNATLPLTSVAQTSGASIVKNKIKGFGAVSDPQTGGTNWDQGLSQVGSAYDVVLFLTDGEPTFYGNGLYGSSNQNADLRKVEESIHSANKIKASGAKVIAVGIGPDVNSTANAQRLKLISGTEEGTDFFTTGFDQLGTKLTELATKDCNGTVTVVKSVQDGPGDPIAGAGWEFSTSTASVKAGSSDNSFGTTDANGALNFKVSGYPSNVTSRKVTIAETQQDGFELVQQSGVNAVCTNLATQKTVAVSSSGALGFTVDVPQADPITCSVINKKLTSKISIVKTAADYNGGQPVTGPDNAPNVPSGTSVTWTYTVTNTGTTTLKNIVVQDDPVGTATCKKTTLAPAESTTCTATGIVKAQ